MFRLLALLLAVHFSSRVEGAPGTAVVESRENAAVNNANPLDLILGTENLENKYSPAFAEENVPLPVVELAIRAPGIERSLEPRTLGNFEQKPSTWRERLTKIAREAKTTIASKASECVIRCGTKNSSTENSSLSKLGLRTAGNGASRGGSPLLNGSSFPLEGPSFPPKTSPLGPTPVYYEPDVIRFRRESAIDKVRAVRIPLSKRGANPYKDERLAKLIDSTYYLYHEAFNLPLPNFEKLDDKSCMKQKLAALERIFKELDAQKSRAASRQSPPKPLIPESKIEGFTAFREAKEEAAEVVNAARVALALPGANPFKDKELADLVGIAIEEYRKAHRRTPLVLQGLDEEYDMKVKVGEINRIFQEVDEKNARLQKIEARLDEFIG